MELASYLEAPLHARAGSQKEVAVFPHFSDENGTCATAGARRTDLIRTGSTIGAPESLGPPRLRSMGAQEMLQSRPLEGETDMAKGEQRGNREAKKPKKEKPKESAAAPSTKGTVASIASSKK